MLRIAVHADPLRVRYGSKAESSRSLTAVGLAKLGDRRFAQVRGRAVRGEAGLERGIGNRKQGKGRGTHMTQAEGWQSPEAYLNRVDLNPGPQSGNVPGRSRWFETVLEPHSGPGFVAGAERAPESRYGSEEKFESEAESETGSSTAKVAGGIPGDWGLGSFAAGEPGRPAIPVAGQFPEIRFPESMSGLIHDARNMVAALELYCDLLEEPGVLHSSFRHYSGELRRVGAANRRLLEELSRLESPGDALFLAPQPGHGPVALSPRARLRSRWQPDRKAAPPAQPGRDSVAPAWQQHLRQPGEAHEGFVRNGYRQAFISGQRVENLAEEVQANRNLLVAMLGHGVTLGVSIRGDGARPIAMTADDLTRVLVNLARNAAEAMPGGGHLQIAIEEGPEFLTLSFTDNGPGIPEHALESVFSPGYSTHIGLEPEGDPAHAWPAQHRGLGLSIVRSLVAAAGGAVWAANRIGDPAGPSLAGPSLAGSSLVGSSLVASSSVGSEFAAERSGSCGNSSPPHGAVFLVEFPLLPVNGASSK